MSKKTSAKLPATTPVESRRFFTPVRVGAFAVLSIAVIAAAFWRMSTGTTVDAQPNAGTATTTSAPPAVDEAALAQLAAHPQANLPPLQFPGYAPPRSPDVIRAVYRFAAEHPEILSYVPCFCGCEREGHRGNEDCFVRARAANGDVVEWEDHGMECAVCIDVAHRSMQMFAAGASARDIRAAIERDFSPRYPNKTPTPMPR